MSRNLLPGVTLYPRTWRPADTRRSFCVWTMIAICVNDLPIMKPTPKGWPRLSASVFYDDPRAAIEWLCQAFGLEKRLVVEGDDGTIVHSELTFGEGLIMVGGTGTNTKREEWS